MNKLINSTVQEKKETGDIGNRFGIRLLSCGEMHCSNEKVFEEETAAVNGSIRMCFVLSGKGALHEKKQLLSVHEEMAFLFFPEDRMLYRAAFLEPWHLVWLDFAGDLCRPLMEKLGFQGVLPFRRVEQTLLQIARKTVDQIRWGEEESLEQKLRRMSLLLDLLAWMASTNPNKPQKVSLNSSGKEVGKEPREGYRHVQFLENYFRENYRERIVMGQLAKKMGITPYYMCHIFQKHRGMSPTEFLSDIRIIEAMRLLENTNYPIARIAEECGYQNTINFSKFFSRKNGCSPTTYRKNKASPGELRDD